MLACISLLLTMAGASGWVNSASWGAAVCLAGIAATLGMASGLGVTLYYMATTQPWLRSVFGVTSPVELWWGIQPISAGLFGVPVGFAVIILVSLFTPAPDKKTQELVEHVRYPELRGAAARAA